MVNNLIYLGALWRVIDFSPAVAPPFAVSDYSACYPLVVCTPSRSSESAHPNNRNCLPML
jgi:hypothetical protein